MIKENDIVLFNKINSNECSLGLVKGKPSAEPVPDDFLVYSLVL
jgi:hypothetical protein